MLNQMPSTMATPISQVSDVALDIDPEQLKVSIHGQEHSFDSVQDMDDFLAEFWQRSIS
jgi:hypothetical protein